MVPNLCVAHVIPRTRNATVPATVQSSQSCHCADSFTPSPHWDERKRRLQVPQSSDDGTKGALLQLKQRHRQMIASEHRLNSTGGEAIAMKPVTHCMDFI